MDDQIEKQLDQAARDLSLSSDSFARCDPESAKSVVQKGRDTFVVGNPRAWWMSLKYSFDSFDYSEGFRFEDMPRHVPPGVEKCWFIPETEEECLPVFDAKVRCIPLVLARCISFEYYLMGKGFDWLIAESDHDQIIVSRVPLRRDRP